MSRPVQLLRSPRLPGVFVAICMLLFACAAKAEETTPPRLEFYFTPYLWISGTSGDFSTRNPNIPTQTATASFGDILSHLNSVPVMGAFEVRYGRFGLLADIIAVSLKGDVPTKGPAFNGGSAKLTEFIATIMATYRALELRNQFLDVGIGVRPVAYWTEFTFNSGVLPGFSRSPSVSWADPLLGARYHLDLSKRFGLTAYGDVGGFGAGSNLTWQLLGTVDYRFNQWLVMHTGYRHLHIDYRGDVLHADTALSGPIIGATIRF